MPEEMRAIGYICPECGKAYVSGGTTRTVTAESQEAVKE